MGLGTSPSRCMMMAEQPTPRERVCTGMAVMMTMLIPALQTNTNTQPKVTHRMYSRRSIEERERETARVGKNRISP